MARQLRIEYAGAFYHVLQRGIEKKNIFICDKDKEKFLSYLDSAHIAYTAIFHAYVLMDNHYHIILETPQANLSKIMHYLNTSYAIYYNTKYKRVGPLYQGRFKAVLVQHNEYLYHLSRYIHLNPVRGNIVKLPQEYPWSSYKYFISHDKPPRWLNINFILSMFDNDVLKAKKLYRQFVIDRIGNEKDILDKNTYSGFVCGNRDFFESIKNKFISEKKDYEIPVLKELKIIGTQTLENIKKKVEENVQGNDRLKRKLAIYLSRKYTQKSLIEIADFYCNIKYPAVSQAFKRVKKQRGKDKKLDRLLLKIERRIQ